MKITELFFPFEPKPKGRPRFDRRSGHMYTPKATKEYEKSITEFYKANCNEFYENAIKIKLVFNMPIPKSETKKTKELMANGVIKCIKHTGDVDNLAKSLIDALNGVAFFDDCLITEITACKRYSETVGTLMTISEDGK